MNVNPSNANNIPNANVLAMYEKQYVSGLQMMLKGMSIMLAMMADSIGSVDSADTACGVTDIPQAAVPSAIQETPADQNQRTEAKRVSMNETGQASVKTASEPIASVDSVAPTHPAETATPSTATAKPIARIDLERAMAAKIKALTAQGRKPDEIGELFPKFHGAQRVSDLTVDDYPGFLEALAQL